jgi:phage shock protein PspC (stress-responsive transcriptional regulator)
LNAVHGPEQTFLRPKDDRKLAGVAAALARRAGLDATLVRGTGVLFLVLATLLWWPSLLLIAALYVALAFGVPSE